MDAAHWHLVLTHVPVVGVVFALLLLAVGVVAAHPVVRRLGLAAVVLVALLALPTYFTGEPAEDVLERLPGVSERVIDRHQEAATRSLIVLEVAGGLALAALVLGARTAGAPTAVVAGVLLVTAVSAGLLGWTANLGGQVRHTEIRTSEAPMPADQEIRSEARSRGGARGDDD